MMKLRIYVEKHGKMTITFILIDLKKSEGIFCISEERKKNIECVPKTNAFSRLY